MTNRRFAMLSDQMSRMSTQLRALAQFPSRLAEADFVPALHGCCWETLDTFLLIVV